jgi:hypothetical protein
MVDSNLTRPINYSLSRHTNQKSNDFQLIDSKGIPCHVVKVEKDIVTVAFDTHNGVWTVPTMKMPQAFSSYARDATQVGDHGYAVRSNYYLGGNSGLGGGVADYGPRGNLTPLTFHPISRTQSQTRDYDQYTVTGGKTGVKIWQGPPPSQQQQQGQQGTSSGGQGGGPQGGQGAAAQARALPHQASLSRSLAALRPPYGRVRTSHWRPGGFVAARAAPAPAAATGGSSSSSGPQGGSGQQQPSGASMEIDKNGLIQHVSADGKSKVTVDQANNKITLDTTTSNTVFCGGDGKTGKYLPVLCVGNVPAINVKARTG